MRLIQNNHKLYYFKLKPDKFDLITVNCNSVNKEYFLKKIAASQHKHISFN